MKLAMRSDMAEIPKAKQALQRFAEQSQLPFTVLQAAELALDELLTNVVSYAGAGDDANAIELILELEVDALRISVSDAGIAFDPFATRLPPAAPDLPLEQRDLGGHGIQLIAEFMDSCSYQRLGGRNVVILRKLL